MSSMSVVINLAIAFALLSMGFGLLTASIIKYIKPKYLFIASLVCICVAVALVFKSWSDLTSWMNLPQVIKGIDLFS